MTKKNLFLIAFLLALVTVYIVCFTDWFKPRMIEISHISRGTRAVQPNLRGAPAIVPIIFKFESGACKLTALKVVPLEALKTNRFALPVWSLISDSNSLPIESFSYGEYIRGMKPAVTGTRSQSLEPNTYYRLFITTTAGKGQHDFQAKVQ